MPTTEYAVQCAKDYSALGSNAGEEVYHSKKEYLHACMRVAYLFAQDRSKDPVDKVGAAVLHPISGGIFLGYNGFPPGAPDYKRVWDNKNRGDGLLSKFAHVIHAEENAVNKARSALGDRVRECDLLVLRSPCPNCMNHVIQPAGIRRVFYTEPHDDVVVSQVLANQYGIHLACLPVDLSDLNKGK